MSMKESDIERLLRARLPESPAVPPGLGLRIRASLRGQPLSRRRLALPAAWLFAPAAAIAVALFLAALFQGRPQPVVAQAPAEPAELPSVRMDAAAALATNPLDREAEALRNDAQRTGRFLLDCLPSLSLAGN